MAGFQERTEAAVKAFRESWEYSKSLRREVIKFAADPKTGTVVHINGAFLAATVSVDMVPLAVGEAVTALIKPPVKK